MSMFRPPLRAVAAVLDLTVEVATAIALVAKRAVTSASPNSSRDTGS
jgi:hypothetical protein